MHSRSLVYIYSQNFITPCYWTWCGTATLQTHWWVQQEPIGERGEKTVVELSHDSIQLADKEIVVTEGDDVLSKPLLLCTSALAACNHEEANSDITLHAARAAHSGHKKILIRTVDTDVVVLAVALACTPVPEGGN